MKRIIFSFVMVAFTVSLMAQAAPAKGILYSYKSSGTDTLGASTTLTFQYTEGTREVDFVTLWDYSWTVKSDSISGADNAGTVALQVSNSPASVASPLWVTVDTETIDGAADQFFVFEGVLNARRMRLLITSPSGTRATVVNVEGAVKKRPQ
jgi:hypothetical protein